MFLMLSCIPPVYAEDGEASSGETSSDTQQSVSDGNSVESSVSQSETGKTEATEESQGEADSASQNPVINEVVNINPDQAQTATDNPQESPTENIENPAVEVEVDIAETSEAPVNISEGAVGSDAVESDEAESNIEYLESEVLNVVVPISISVTIDPLELAGKGQIYSKDYRILNKGDSEVLLTFDNIKLVFSDDANFKTVAEPFSNTFFKGMKTIYMELGFGTRDIPPAVITDISNTNQISIPLSNPDDSVDESSHLQFNFSGCVNEAPTSAWQDNDVIININYTLQTVRINEDVIPPEDVIQVEEPEIKQEQPIASDNNQQPGETEIGKATPAEEATPVEQAIIKDEAITTETVVPNETPQIDSSAEPAASPPTDSNQASVTPDSSVSEASSSQTTTTTTSSETSQDSQSSTGESSTE